MPVQFGGLAVDSEIPIPGPDTARPPDVVVRRGDVPSEGGVFVQEWPDADGRRWLSIFRTASGYRISVANLECLVSADGRHVIAKPGGHLDEATLVHLLLQQVLPLAVSRTGRLVLHACAVETPAGALAFAGETGIGKSTLSAAFCRRGHALIADDALVIGVEQDGFTVAPTADTLRLWPYMRDVLGGAEELPPAPGKLRARVPIAVKPSPLARILLLGTSEDLSVSIVPAPTSQMRVDVLSHLFRLDVGDAAESRRVFDDVHRLIERVPVRRALYPDGPEHLDAVVDAILRDSISGARERSGA